MLKTLYKNKFLLWQLIKKDIQQRYQGSVLGILWSFIVPILMLVIYTFIFIKDKCITRSEKYE